MNKFIGLRGMGKGHARSRKVISILLLITLLVGLGLAGCGGTTGSQPAQPQNQQSQVTQQNQPAQDTPQSQETGKEASSQKESQKQEAVPEQAKIQKDGTYTSMQDVADYLHEYGKLPKNFITKNEAKKLGWDSEKGNLGKVAPGKSIGGDSFGNREGLLPKKDGRKYYECDIDYDGGYRDAKRIIYSNDGLIYYTDDHYKTFTQLY